MNSKTSNLYKANLILEIILFSVSVVGINFFIGKQNWLGVSICAIVVIIFEIILKVQGYNPFLNLAKKREVKILEIEKQGVTNLYFMRDAISKNNRNSAISKAIDESNELFLLAETGNSYIDIPTDRHWKNIKKKIDEGKKFKILLINPSSPNKVMRNKLNGDEKDRKFNIERIQELSKHENVSIKFTNEIYCTLFFTDQYMIYDPYHLGKIGDRIENNFIALEFKNQNENYNILKSHFENCWDAATDIVNQIDR